MKFRILPILTWIAVTAMLSSGQELPIPSSPVFAHLSPNEIREGILYIEKFSLAVETEALLRDALKRERELAERDTHIFLQRLELEQAKTELAVKEATLEKARGDFYKDALDRLTRGRGAGCWVKKIFTLGLAKCLG